MLTSALVHWAVTHQQEFPDHGVNCICADQQIRHLRQAVTIAPSVEALSKEDRNFVAAAQSRITYILSAASDSHA